MKYGESIAARRRIPVYLVDSSGNPANVGTPTGSQIQVSKSGGAWSNGAGTWGEVDDVDGSYYYEATAAEVTTDSFLILRIAHPSAETFVFVENIGNRVPQDALTSERLIAVYLTNDDGSGDPVTGLGGSGGVYDISTNGSAFAALADTVLHEIGLGAYYVQLSAAEIAVIGTRVLRVTIAGARVYVYRFDVGEAQEAVAEETLTPLAGPLVYDDLVALDFAQHAVDRLPQYAKFRSG